MSDLAVQLVESLIKETAVTLERSFAAYWPTFGDTGPHEANLSLHTAHAFLNHGFHVYGEGHGYENADRRYDLLAYSVEQSLFVAAEYKQAWSKAKIREMHGDLERVLDFRPVTRRPGPFPSLPPGVQRVGVVAALSESDERYRQLFNPEAIGGCDATNTFKRSLREAGAVVGSHRLCPHGRHPGRGGEFHLIYAIVQLLSDAGDSHG